VRGRQMRVSTGVYFLLWTAAPGHGLEWWFIQATAMKEVNAERDRSPLVKGLGSVSLKHKHC